MNESSVLADVSEKPGIFYNPGIQNVGKTRKISAKMGESLFIVEYDGSVPLNLPADWPLPSYEVRRKLPMKECMECRADIYFEDSYHALASGWSRRIKARKTSWIFRKRGEFFWNRICWNHMKPEMRAVIKEMYSR